MTQSPPGLSLCSTLSPVSQEKRLWEALVGPVFVSRCKTLQLDNMGSCVIVEYLDFSLYLNLLKLLYTYLKILSLHLSAFRAHNTKRKEAVEGGTRPNWQFLLRPMDSPCLLWKGNGLNASPTVCMNLQSV